MIAKRSKSEQTVKSVFHPILPLPQITDYKIKHKTNYGFFEEERYMDSSRSTRNICVPLLANEQDNGEWRNTKDRFHR